MPTRPFLPNFVCQRWVSTHILVIFMQRVFLRVGDALRASFTASYSPQRSNNTPLGSSRTFRGVWVARVGSGFWPCLFIDVMFPIFCAYVCSHFPKIENRNIPEEMHWMNGIFWVLHLLGCGDVATWHEVRRDVGGKESLCWRRQLPWQRSKTRSQVVT